MSTATTTKLSANKHCIVFFGWKSIALAATYAVAIGLLGYAIGARR